METEKKEKKHRNRGAVVHVPIKDRWQIVLDIKKGMSYTQAGRINQRTAATCQSIYKKYLEIGDVVDKWDLERKLKKSKVDSRETRKSSHEEVSAPQKVAKDASTQTTLSWSKIERDPKGKAAMLKTWTALRRLEKKNFKEEGVSNDQN